MLPESTISRYDNLNGDVKVKAIRARQNNFGRAAIFIENPVEIVDQFNLPGQFSQMNNLFIGDASADGMKEININYKHRNKRNKSGAILK